MRYDLLLTGGGVLDLGAGLRGTMDIGITGGKIAAVSASLPANEARRTISAKRRLVTQLTLKDGRVWYERVAE